MTRNEIQLVIFDLDETIIKTIGKDIYIYKYVIPVFEYLKLNNIKICLASYNPCAFSILMDLNLNHYFEIIEYEYWETRYDYPRYIFWSNFKID